MDQTGLRDAAVSIVRRLRAAGHEAYIVGGAVRDMVLGLGPKDYDIATDAGPDDVDRLFDRVYHVGRAFGVSIVAEGPCAIEVAMFRREGGYQDGRRPRTVEAATPGEDVLRRDFTMNALMYDPIGDRIIDMVGGRRDIEAGVVRTVGDADARLGEDRLRMLRAVRFAARFGFALDGDTERAIHRHAGAIGQVSRERIGEELSLMFRGPNPDRALVLLNATGLLERVLPEVAALEGVLQPPRYHPEGDVLEHTRIMLGMSGDRSEALAFGILLHDVGKPPTMTVTDRIRFNNHQEVGADMAEAVLRRLRRPGGTVRRVSWLVRNHMRFINVREMKRTTLRRFMAEDGFVELLELYRLDCLASHGRLDGYEFVRDVMEEEAAANDGLHLPPPLLTGNDLIDLGYEPGPLFGRILDDIVERQLENRVATKGEAIDYVLETYPQQRRRRNPRRKSSRWD